MSRTASSRWKSVLPLADMCVPVLVSPALVPKPWKEVERPDWIVLGVRLHYSSRYRSRSSRTSSSSSASGRQRSPPLTSSILPPPRASKHPEVTQMHTAFPRRSLRMVSTLSPSSASAEAPKRSVKHPRSGWLEVQSWGDVLLGA